MGWNTKRAFHIAVVLMTRLLISGNKSYFLYQKIVFVIAILSTLVVIVLMATTSKEAFIARFNSLAQPYSNSTDTYHSILNTASQGGYALNAPYSLTQTVFFFVWPWFAIGYCFLSASFSGEVRGVKKSQLFDMLGSAVISEIILLITLEDNKVKVFQFTSG